MAANITDLIDKLPNASKQLDVLEDLKTVLGSFHPTVLRNIVPNISFSVIFECLNTNDSNQLDICCEVLKKLLSAVDASVVLHHFHDDLLLGLKHPGVPVKLLSLSQICRVSKEAVEELAQNVDIVQQLVRCIADDSLEVAKTTGEILIAIGISSSGLDALYIDSQEVLSDVLAVSDTIRFRVYEMWSRIIRERGKRMFLVHEKFSLQIMFMMETQVPKFIVNLKFPNQHSEVIIGISKASIIGLQQSSEVGLLIQIVNELQKDDILVQLNCLEYLSDLALTDHGLLYLDQQGVVGTLGRMMSTVESDPLAGFLIPGLMKFFGCIARVHPKEVCSRNRNFVNIVFSNLSSKDQSLCNIAIQTVGLIGSTLEGKLALEKLGPVMDGGVKCLGKLLRDLQPDLKIKVLQCLSSLLELKVADQSMDMLKLLEKWYTLLGSKTFDYLMSLTQIPFTEVRCSAFSLLRSLAFQPWGQRLMNDHPGFNEYLLDRSTEQIKEGKEAKYEIVSILAESPTSGDIFGQPYQVKLKAYALQGPFYKRVQAEVAIDENN